MRVVFLGNSPLSVPSLEAIASSGHVVSRVVTRVPRPAGRGSTPRATAVAESARRLGLPLAEVETVRGGSGFDTVAEQPCDVLAVVAYGEILPATVLDLPAVGPVNVHFSLLPALRGAAPVQRAILEGLAVTGVTTIRMDEGMDTGPILLQKEEAIRPDDDAGTLGGRLAEVGGGLLVQTIDRLEAGAVAPRAQDHDRATYAPKLRPEDRIIDWTRPASAVVRQVRAMAPAPGATTMFRGRFLKVLRSLEASGESAHRDAEPERAERSDAQILPGRVLVAGKRGLTVAAGEGALWLIEVAPEGRGRMSGPDFVRGYRPHAGEILG
jgi:methionyl-tRNA formyltransferase